jgi:Uma2 family endonuclease
MSAQPSHWLTPEEYLELERAAEFRHEYFNGHMYAMAGGSPRHAFIIGNLVGELHAALKRGPCVVATSDLRVCVDAGGLYTYPDIAVICGEPKFVDRRSDTVLNPVLLIEVLSPSTALLDREFKFAQYRTLESLQEYALVSQNEARVEIFRRQEGGQWLLSEFAGLEAAARFDSVDASVPLQEIYDKISFEPERD